MRIQGVQEMLCGCNALMWFTILILADMANYNCFVNVYLESLTFNVYSRKFRIK